MQMTVSEAVPVGKEECLCTCWIGVADDHQHRYQLQSLRTLCIASQEKEHVVESSTVALALSDRNNCESGHVEHL
jgi:NOL1/NOP2/fmu family ribosome biogenesis protein